MRVAESDRALDTVGRLLTTYGRHAFDTETAAAALREQCERWVQRIVLGDTRGRDSDADATDAAPLRDWHGLSLFFDQQRRKESDFVLRTLGGLRDTVLSLARCLSTSIGQDEDADAHLERQLKRLSGALERGTPNEIARAATIVIDTAREAMARRRSRDARHVKKLEQRLRDLREELSENCKQAGIDAVTGLFTLTAFEQQIEQVAAMGMLLGQRPWLVLMSLDDAGRDDAGANAPLAPGDAALREVSKCVSRTFLRKEDFIACIAPDELGAVLVDIRRDQLVPAIERLLASVSRLGSTDSALRGVSMSVGMACLRPGDEAAEWRARAAAALARAKEAGGNEYELSQD